MPSELLAEPHAVVSQIAALGRAAAVKLPFDIDPTGFTADLEKLAARYSSGQ